MFIVQAYRNDLLLNVSEPSPHCNLLQSSFLADAKNVLKSFCKKEWGLGGEGKKLFAKSLFPRPKTKRFTECRGVRLRRRGRHRGGWIVRHRVRRSRVLRGYRVYICCRRT